MTTYRFFDASVATLLPPELAHPLSLAFAPHRASPASAAPEVRIVARRVGTGYEVAVSPGALHTGATLVEALELIEWTLAERLLAAAKHMVQLHAAGAVVDGRAILVLGTGGAGKSSIAFALHRQGLPVLGDDVVLLGPDARATAFTRLFKLDPTLLEAAGVVRERTPGWAPGSAEAWYAPGGGAGWAAPAPVGLVAVARRDPGVSLTVQERSRSWGLAALLESVLPTGRSRAEAFEMLAGVVRGARAVEVAFGSSREAADALAALMR